MGRAKRVQGDRRKHIEPPPVERLSPLYCLFNGFMLGVFTFLCGFEPFRGRYRALRWRIQSFLNDMGARVRIPASFPGEDAWEARVDSIDKALAASPLNDAYVLGFSATLCTLTGLPARDARALARGLKQIAKRNKLPTQPLDELIPRRRRRYGNEETLVSPVLALLAGFIKTLDGEDDTCFVAMPFRPPFEGYFRTFYQPLLKEAGFRAVRAWGGVGIEDYLPLMLTLMHKSGALLADVSRGNRNVMWEVGVAHGSGKHVFQLCSANSRIPANLQKQGTFIYDSTQPDWRRRTIHEIAWELSEQWVAHRRISTDPIRAASGLRHRDLKGTRTFLLAEATALEKKPDAKKRARV